eukprot:TRINITY_DN2616_c0_g1_i2.p1 TRINITY_DN2616_c0_g1~~TRINITY_DN2616_c0_g1_i2.p1  ORF type:complete len:102 (-),score=26.59 TRINITY_DN2616_c0_g1_i2:102-407(-)
MQRKHKQGHAFAVVTQRRIFFMYPETATEAEEWLKALSRQIDILRSASGSQNSAKSLGSEKTPGVYRRGGDGGDHVEWGGKRKIRIKTINNKKKKKNSKKN